MPRSNHYERVVTGWMRSLKTQRRRRIERRRQALTVPRDRRTGRDRRGPLV